jgi:uncharacterized phage protein gp47/JayE
MAFIPRTYDTILADMIAHVRANTTLTDFNVGSVIRTILEAAALEDDEQYFQMVQLLDAFSYQTATGTELDERAADFNVTRLSAAEAVGQVRFQNGGLETDFLQFSASSGATTVTLTDSDDFPTSGYPYTVRIGEGTPSVEDVSVTANDTATNILTHGALVNNHSIGDRVSLVTGISDVDISSGVSVQVPATGATTPIAYQTTELATIIAGDYQSGLTDIVASEAGTLGNVGASRITQFTGSIPFAGALVTNPASTGGGRDIETDPELRDRLRLRLQELGLGTPLAVTGSAIGVEDVQTGQRVVTSQLLEDWSDNEHTLFIDDGTGFVPTSVRLARSTLTVATPPHISQLTLTDTSGFPAAGTVLISPGDSAQAELIAYTSKTDSTNVLTLAANTTLVHDIGDEVALIDALPLAEEGQNYFQLTNYPIQENSPEIYDDSSGLFELQTPGTDYFINRSSGQVQYYGSGLPAGTQVVAHYTYYTGLLALAQKTINGDVKDAVSFPGVSAAGIIIHVETPTIRTITVIMSVSVSVGFTEADVYDDVQLILENYIDGLRIGENVILARMVELAMGVNGVSNAKVLTPTADLVILEEELPKSFDSSGNSLVTVV